MEFLLNDPQGCTTLISILNTGTAAWTGCWWQER